MADRPPLVHFADDVSVRPDVIDAIERVHPPIDGKRSRIVTARGDLYTAASLEEIRPQIERGEESQ